MTIASMILACTLAANDGWLPVSVPGPWERSGEATLARHDGFAWYRVFVRLDAASVAGDATLDLGAIDDSDECFVNGTRVGATGGMPPAANSAWSATRSYRVAQGTLREGWNAIAVRVHDSGGNGGIHRGPVRLVTAAGTRSLQGRWEIRTGDDATWAMPRDVDAEAAAFLARGPGAAGQRPEMRIDAGTPEADLPCWTAPAQHWNEALPVGNGRLGAMVFGGTDRERIQLNEISLWARSPSGRIRRPAPDLLAKARELWFAGDIRGCQELMQRSFMSTDLDASHQTAGDLAMGVELPPNVSGYTRSLDVLGSGGAVTRFEAAGRTFTRTTRMTPWTIETNFAQSGEPLPVTIELGRAELFEGTARILERSQSTVDLVLTGRARNGDHHGVRYVVMARVTVEEGTIERLSTSGLLADVGVQAERAVSLRTVGAPEVRVSIAVATDFDGGDPNAAAESLLAAERTVDVSAEEMRLYGRDRPGAIRIGSQAITKPIPALLDQAKRSAPDEQLVNAYLAFCRHLIRDGSRGDPAAKDLPTNLQGLWNEHLLAPWNADYHTNINLQMNYWSAEQLGLGSRVDALTDYIDRLAVDGATTAGTLYGARGWVCHHTSDPWGMTLPMGLTVWGLWPHGGGWLVRHCWEHYCFTMDREYLERRAFPLMRGASEFYLDWLTTDPATGKLVGGPSSSPENSFLLEDGSRADVGMGNAMDQEIVWDCLTNLVDAARVLGIRDDAIVERAKEALAKLAWPTIGDDGRLQEWSRPFREAEPGHRHVSHLYGVYPSRQFMEPAQSAYLAAARKSLETRLANGGGHTGWSRAWLINLTARMRDGEAAYGHLSKLLTHSTLPNLFDDHPPFQIDGNYGGLAGACEMLMQSHELTWEGDRPSFLIDLLPALPKAWPDGSASLCARGGAFVTIEWSDGLLREATITRSGAAPLPDLLRLRVPEGTGRAELVGDAADTSMSRTGTTVLIRDAARLETIRLRWR